MKNSERCGVPGVLGSIKCYKWTQKNFPTMVPRKYEGKEKKATVTPKAITNRSLWTWNIIFGVLGWLNDIKVLESSPLLSKIVSGKHPNFCE